MSTDSHIPATVGILTFNSAKTLRRALDSVSAFEDIVLCDGGSTDETLEIAAACGAHVIAQSAEFKNPNGTLNHFGGVRQQLLDAAKYDWFLYIDSDETISDGLREDIRRITTSPLRGDDPLVYRVPIGIILNDRIIKYSSNYPGYQHRFFNRTSGAHFIKPVHERIEFDKTSTPIGTLAHPWYIHTTNDDWDHYLAHTAGYRRQEVAIYAARPWRHFWTAIVLRGMRTSLGAILKSSRNYLLHGFTVSMPVRGEIGRALAPWYLMGAILRAKLS